MPTLLAHYKLDEGSGTTAIDSVGGFDGTLIDGVSYDADAPTLFVSNPDSLLDDGTGYISVGNPMGLQLADLSVSMWIKTTEAGGSYRLLAGKPFATTLYMLDDQLIVSTVTANMNSGFYPNTGEWIHVGYSFQSSGGVGKIYGAGKMVYTEAGHSIGNQDHDWTFGGVDGGQWFSGRFDDVRIYSGILSDLEFAALAAGYDLTTFSGGGGGIMFNPGMTGGMQRS